MKLATARRVIAPGRRLSALEGLRRPYHLAPPLEWDEAPSALRGAPASCVLVVDAGEGDPEALRRLAEVTARFPSLTVVAALEVSAAGPEGVAGVLRAGVAEVIDHGAEATPAGVQARLRQAHARPLKRGLERTLFAGLAPEARELLLAAAEVAVEGGGAPQLAGVLRVAPRTLTERCARARIPAPRHTQAWMRVLLACLLLDDPGRTAHAVARACGYSTDRSLRRAVSAFLGADSTRLRRRGAFSTAASAFAAELEATAAQTESRPAP